MKLFRFYENKNGLYNIVSALSIVKRFFHAHRVDNFFCRVSFIFFISLKYNWPLLGTLNKNFIHIIKYY